MRRREKFLLSAFVLAFGLLGTQYIPLEYRVLGSFVFGVLSYLVSVWALFEDLNGVEWVTIVPLPALYAFSVSLFYFLLPEHLLSRLVILSLFGVGMYALYLTANIYSVAKAKSIQLLRAAHAVGLFFKLLIMFFLSNTILSFHLPFWLNGLGIAVASFPLAMIAMWSVKLEKRITRSVFFVSVVCAVAMGELTIFLSFMPGTLWVNSLYLVGLFYLCLGLATTRLAGRLFSNTIWEYSSFWAFITVIYFALLQWR